MKFRFCFFIFLSMGWALAQNPANHRDPNPVSPARRITRDQPPQPPNPGPAPSQERNLDGTNNNPNDALMGAANTPLLRLFNPSYAGNGEELAGTDLPSPREISNTVFAEAEQPAATGNVSSFLWQWGQFIDHDIDLTGGTDPPESAPIAIPTGDPYFDPSGTGTQEMDFNRSLYQRDPTGLRQKINEISAWIDGSNVYGSDLARSLALRRLDGSGQLKTSAGEFLPYNEAGLSNAGGPSPDLFLAGDVRANEQIGLLVMHTLFVREHNRVAKEIKRQHPDWSDVQIYQSARRVVSGIIQKITYDEFLPVLLGPNPLPPYRGYDPNLDASISNEFSTAAYRFGHSAINSQLLRLDAQFQPIQAGNLALRNAFFAPQRLSEGGLEPVLRGLAAQACLAIDNSVVDDVRNFLFGPPGAGGFDLVSLNIQRGRDHGLPSYNEVRRSTGLPLARRFSDINSDPQIQAQLEKVYGDPDRVELWVGGLSEKPTEGAMVGPTFAAIIRDQFLALRDGDRFWYQRALSPDELRIVESSRLSDVIRRNTQIDRELADDVFHIQPPRRPRP
ncbi:MAG: peroxidase family protein [Acidobacteria bacterium]|nr:peroxidase family protein [Acidobacteriota bacterium]MCB9397085.1 peroxidase family protein [Acidobacteriota bacterium]